MTQEEIELLLRDLCARLSYGVKIHYHYSNSLGRSLDEDRELDFSDVETLKYNIENSQDDWCEIFWKPYLRPMSSMTNEEFEIFDHIGDDDKNYEASYKKTDWLNAHNFDYRNLIGKGLALEASEDMYKNE